MRYDLTDFEWSVIEPLLPMDRRGPKPKNNRQIINGMFYILRTGSPWRDLPERYGPYTTVYNRFNRWRKAGIWDRLMDAIVKATTASVQMIDSSIVRVHQHASGSKKEWRSLCGSKPRWPHHEDPRARRCARPADPAPDLAGKRPDITPPKPCSTGSSQRAIVIADKGYDADACAPAFVSKAPSPTFPTAQPQEEVPLEEGDLPPAQPRRALLQQAQAVPTHRHPLRQARRQLLRLHPACLRPHLLAIN